MTNIYWQPLINRICGLVNKELRHSQDGVVFVTVKIIMSTDNKPLYWIVDDCKRLEPSNLAQQLLEVT